MGDLRGLARRIRKSAAFQRMLERMFAWYTRVILRTTRWRHEGFEDFEADLAGGAAKVFCVWHGRLLMAPFCRDWTDPGLSVLGSDHPDARIATEVMRQMGIDVIPLKTRGGNSASVARAVAVLRGGKTIGITPDGPLGPGEEAKAGAILLASRAQAELVPFAYSTNRRIHAKSWDRFLIPLPFGRGIFLIGQGFVPAPNLDAEGLAAAQARLSRLLTETAAEADRRVDAGDW